MSRPSRSEAATTSRRELLRTAAAGALTASLAATLPGTRRLLADAPKAQGFIDAHVHVWTPNTDKYPLAEGYKKADMQPPSFTPEQLFAHAEPHGVTRVVLIQMSFYGFDNSYMLDMITQHPDVFSGVAVIDETDEPVSRMKQLKDQGVRGFRIRPDARPEGVPAEKWLETPGMRQMWQCGAQEGLAMCHLINPEYLPSVDRMCQRYPDTPVVIDHFARIGIDGQVRARDLENLCQLARHPNVAVKISAYYALGDKKAPYTDLGPMIRRLLESYGPERLMWASDCPFQVVGGHEYGPSINLIRRELEFLSASDRQHLLRRTAERVFFS